MLSPAVIAKLGAIHDLIHGDGMPVAADAQNARKQRAAVPNPETAKLVDELVRQAEQPPQRGWRGTLRKIFSP